MANTPTRQGGSSFDDALYGRGRVAEPIAPAEWEDWGPVVHSRLVADPLEPAVERPGAVRPAETAAAGRTAAAAPRRARAAAHERGLAGWLAVVVLVVVTGLGAAIDEIANGARNTTAFDIALIVGALVSIILVRRRSMFTVVVSPPLIYAIASFILLYLRSGGLGDRRVLLDAAANWLVYGFPAIAAATAAVLIVAGIRLLIRR